MKSVLSQLHHIENIMKIAYFCSQNKFCNKIDEKKIHHEGHLSVSVVYNGGNQSYVEDGTESPTTAITIHSNLDNEPGITITYDAVDMSDPKALEPKGTELNFMYGGISIDLCGAEGYTFNGVGYVGLISDEDLEPFLFQLSTKVETDIPTYEDVVKARDLVLKFLKDTNNKYCNVSFSKIFDLDDYKVQEIINAITHLCEG
jgi:hypothetical protein